METLGAAKHESSAMVRPTFEMSEHQQDKLDHLEQMALEAMNENF